MALCILNFDWTDYVDFSIYKEIQTARIFQQVAILIGARLDQKIIYLNQKTYSA